MTQVITLERVTPIARYDDVPWEEARIEEAATSDAADADWTAIETITLSPVDADPSDPATRNLTTALGTDVDLWYRVVFIDGNGDESSPTDPVQNASPSGAYATTAELARILKLRGTISDEQYDAMQRVLDMAAGEINAELDRSEDDDPLAGWQIALVTEVNLQRAAELWQETPFGIVGLGSDFGPTHTARDSWARHAHKLAPLKTQWGLA